MVIQTQKAGVKDEFGAKEMLDTEQVRKRTEAMHSWDLTSTQNGKTWTFRVEGNISKEDLMKKLENGTLSDKDGLKLYVVGSKGKGKAYLLENGAETVMAHVDIENAKIKKTVENEKKKAKPTDDKLIAKDEGRYQVRDQHGAQEPVTETPKDSFYDEKSFQSPFSQGGQEVGSG